MQREVLLRLTPDEMSDLARNGFGFSLEYDIITFLLGDSPSDEQRGAARLRVVDAHQHDPGASPFRSMLGMQMSAVEWIMRVALGEPVPVMDGAGAVAEWRDEMQAPTEDGGF